MTGSRDPFLVDADPLAEYLHQSRAFDGFEAETMEVQEERLDGDHRSFLVENERLPSMADFTLVNGDRLEFFGLQDRGLSSVLMVERGLCENRSPLLDIEELTGPNVTPMDVFWAVSLPGTPVPRILTDMFSGPSGDFDSQGWAGARVIKGYPSGPFPTREASTDKGQGAPLVAQATHSASPTDLACSNDWFTSSVPGGFLSNNPFIRLDKTPNNYSAFQSDCLNPGFGECWGKPRFKYLARLQTTQSRAKICGRSVQNAVNNHVVYWCGSTCSTKPNCNQPGVSCATYYGPTISCVYFWDGQYHLMKNESNGKIASWTIPANTTGYINWMWHTSQATAHGVQVRYAKPYDEFDFLIDRPGGF